jgi:hypothetical protein
MAMEKKRGREASSGNAWMKPSPPGVIGAALDAVTHWRTSR